MKRRKSERARRRAEEHRRKQRKGRSYVDDVPQPAGSQAPPSGGFRELLARFIAWLKAPPTAAAQRVRLTSEYGGSTSYDRPSVGTPWRGSPDAGIRLGPSASRMVIENNSFENFDGPVVSSDGTDILVRKNSITRSRRSAR